MKFRKKPVVIEAVQWFKVGDHPAVLPVFTHGPNDEHWAPTVPTGEGWIRTLEGTMYVNPGDWIITGVKGEHYPCKPDIFAATYEPAEPEPVKTQWCYSVNEENFYGSSDTEQEAHGEAQDHLHNDMMVGDTCEYWIAKTRPAEEFLRPDMVGGTIADQLDEWLAEEIGWEDRIVELDHAETTELGNMVIQYIRKVNGFRAYGIADAKEHTYTKEEE